MALLLASKARDGGIGRGFLDCGENARITAAAAEAAIQSLDHLCFRRLRIRVEQGDRSQYESGYAVSALHSAFVEEGLLHAMKFSGGQTLNREDFLPYHGRYGCDARDDRLSIEHHCARPALAFAAAVLRASEIEIFANHIQERAIARSIECALLTVDR